jgi:hypothetical protein
VAPPLLSLPFAFAALGWTAGIICLVVGAVVTFYSYNLISRVLEHHAQQGRRQLRFRDMATDILGQFTSCCYSIVFVYTYIYNARALPHCHHIRGFLSTQYDLTVVLSVFLPAAL